MKLSSTILCLAALCGTSGCGDDAGSGGGNATSTATGDDGRYHPQKSGQPQDEASACQALLTALEQTRTQLGCTTTLRTCPSLVQTEGGAPCLQYDAGTITGCAAYYREAMDCPDFQARLTNCAFEPISGSEGLGCPGSGDAQGLDRRGANTGVVIT